MISASELLGDIRIPRPRRKRAVVLLDVTAAGHLARKMAIREKNRRYQAKLRAHPELRKDRSEYMRAWRAANRERMQKYRDDWIARNPELHRVYKREWKRRKAAKEAA